MIKSIIEASIANKDVLIRVDLNVPFEKGKVSDTSRIMAILPTINYIVQNNGRPILISHFGRPKEKGDVEFSLNRILTALHNAFGTNVSFCPDLDSESIKKFINQTPKEKIILLENTRFFEGEETNSPKLSKMLAGLADLFCNDAFSACHRSHASTVGVARYLPSYSGLLLEKEIMALEKVLSKPKKPVVAVIGGSKVSTKITLLNNLIHKVNHIVIGGGMANTFLFAKNQEVGLSLCEKNLANIARKILTDARRFNCKIHLPLDIVCATALKIEAKSTIYEIDACPKNKMILDAGPKTIENIRDIFELCSTLIWNGPLGAFEISPFNNATKSVALIASRLTKEKKLLSIAGGGDTVAALNSSGAANDFSYISNAGGAFLEWMEGKSLPGVNALTNNQFK